MPDTEAWGVYSGVLSVTCDWHHRHYRPRARVDDELDKLLRVVFGEAMLCTLGDRGELLARALRDRVVGATDLHRFTDLHGVDGLAAATCWSPQAQSAAELCRQAIADDVLLGREFTLVR